MNKGVATWRCKCGVSVKVITETDRARINEDIRHEAQCPNCGDSQIVYARRILAVTMYKTKLPPQLPKTGACRTDGVGNTSSSRTGFKTAALGHR